MIRFALPFLVLLVCGPALSADGDTPYCTPGETVVLAAEDGFFPYTGLYQGRLRGFSLDIVTAAYEAVGCDLELVQMPYNRCTREVQAGRKSGCFNTTNSNENRQKYVFHDHPLFRGRILVYAPATYDGNFTADEFRKATFSVVRGYTYTDAFDSDPKIDKIQVETDFQTLALVARGRADFAVVYEKVAQFHIGNNREQISPAPVPVFDLVDFDLFVSFTKTDPEHSAKMARALDAGLERIRRDGVYTAIEAAWEKWLTIGVAKGEPAPKWTQKSS